MKLDLARLHRINVGCTTNLTNGEFCLDTIVSEEAFKVYNILKDRMLLERWSIKSHKEN